MRDAAAPESLMRSGWYRHYCLFVVFLVLTLAYADRTILGVVIEQIKYEFGLSDLQIGLVSGPAFALFYAVVGIPLARWSDMGNRRIVITFCLTVWSAMTAMGGLCQNFWQLFITRVGVGIGEAGATPPTHSLVSDYYPSHQHGRAASALVLAIMAGSVLGLALGGWLLVHYGWRTTLYALGLPGLAVALLAFFTLHEPRTATRFPSWTEMLGKEARDEVVALLRNHTIRHLLLGNAAYSFLSYGIMAFSVPFYVRSFGVNEAQVGAAMGPVNGGAALLATLSAAFLVDFLQKRDVRWLLRLPAVSVMLAFPCYLAVALASEFGHAMVALFAAMFLLGLAGPAVFATLYAVVRSDQRGMSVALLGLAANVIGLGLGPVCLGALSDALQPIYGTESLRYALAIFTAFAFWASIHMFIGARTLADNYVGARPDQH